MTMDMLQSFSYLYVKQEKRVLTYQVFEKTKYMKRLTWGLEPSNSYEDDDNNDTNSLYWMIIFARHFSEHFIWIN